MLYLVLTVPLRVEVRWVDVSVDVALWCARVHWTISPFSKKSHKISQRYTQKSTRTLMCGNVTHEWKWSSLRLNVQSTSPPSSSITFKDTKGQAKNDLPVVSLQALTVNSQSRPHQNFKRVPIYIYLQQNGPATSCNSPVHTEATSSDRWPQVNDVGTGVLQRAINNRTTYATKNSTPAILLWPFSCDFVSVAFQAAAVKTPKVQKLACLWELIPSPARSWLVRMLVTVWTIVSDWTGGSCWDFCHQPAPRWNGTIQTSHTVAATSWSRNVELCWRRNTVRCIRFLGDDW